MAFRKHSINGRRKECQRQSYSHVDGRCCQPWSNLREARPLLVVSSWGILGYFSPFPLDIIPNPYHLLQATYTTLASLAFSKWLSHLLPWEDRWSSSAMMLSLPDFWCSTEATPCAVLLSEPASWLGTLRSHCIWMCYCQAHHGR